jgi:hypothetical protein
MLHYNGSQELLAPQIVNGKPTGVILGRQGNPFDITGQPGDTPGSWKYIVLNDGSTKWGYQPYPNDPNLYRLTQVSGDLGGVVHIFYDSASRLDKFINDKGQPLLTLKYDANGYLSTLTDYDPNGKPYRQVTYAFGPAAGKTCLLGVSIINQPNKARWI